MKVEIDIDELTALKNAITQLQKQKKELSEKLNYLDERNLIKVYEGKAIKTAIKLAGNYLDLIFVKLGFNKSDGFYPPLVFEGNFAHWLDDDWFKHGERINVIIKADVYNDWKKLTVKLGLISKEDVKKVSSILELGE